MRIFVKSFGCSSNLADGEVLAGCLAEAGYTLVDSVCAADVVVLNTCAVKEPTENRMIELLKRVPASKKSVVAGCLPLINFERLVKETRFDGIIGPAAGQSIVGVVKCVLDGGKVVALKEATCAQPGLGLPRFQSNPVISIMPINYGCLGSCAYCCVVFARGKLRSYGIQEIVDRVRKDLASGTYEFWLTSQDTACYGRDKGTNLAELLRALDTFDGKFKIRVGMMTPNTTMDILEELIQAFRSERVFKFVHLPVQSGDDHVLKSMRRLYSANDFKMIVATFRANFPEVALSTDVICGFPGESNEAFETTLRLIEEIKPDVVNISKFFARPRTPAMKMQEEYVPILEIKRRSSLAAGLAKRIVFERNQRWVGWSGDVLVDEVGKVKGSWIGRNFAYKPVTVKSVCNLLGKTVYVKIARAFATHLEAEIVN